MTEEGKFPRCLIEKIDDQALAPDGFFELAEDAFLTGLLWQFVSYFKAKIFSYFSCMFL